MASIYHEIMHIHFSPPRYVVVYYLTPVFEKPREVYIVWGTVAVSAISGDIFPYISFAIKASFLNLTSSVYAKTKLLICF